MFRKIYNKLFNNEIPLVVKTRIETPELDLLQMTVEGYRVFLTEDIYESDVWKYHNKRYLNNIVKYANNLKKEKYEI